MRLENYADALSKRIGYSTEIGVELSVTIERNTAIVRGHGVKMEINFAPDTKNRHTGVLGAFGPSGEMLGVWTVTETAVRRYHLCDEMRIENGIDNAVFALEDYILGREGA